MWPLLLLPPTSCTISLDNNLLLFVITSDRGLPWAFVFGIRLFPHNNSTVCSNCWWVYVFDSYISVINSVSLWLMSLLDSSSCCILCHIGNHRLSFSSHHWYCICLCFLIIQWLILLCQELGPLVPTYLSRDRRISEERKVGRWSERKKRERERVERKNCSCWDLVSNVPFFLTIYLCHE